jgi:secreted trypsin-like serine protease
VGLDKDSCKGDSGGPAYIDVDGEWQLAGATSRGTCKARRICGDGGIYTRVHAYVDWIESVAGPLP